MLCSNATQSGSLLCVVSLSHIDSTERIDIYTRIHPYTRTPVPIDKLTFNYKNNKTQYTVCPRHTVHIYSSNPNLLFYYVHSHLLFAIRAIHVDESAYSTIFMQQLTAEFCSRQQCTVEKFHFIHLLTRRMHEQSFLHSLQMNHRIHLTELNIQM